MQNFATKFSLIMMLICEQSSAISGCRTRNTVGNFFDLVMFYWIIYQSVKKKRIYYLKINPGKVTDFSINQFFFTLLGIFPHILEPGTASLRAPGFKTIPFPWGSATRTEHYTGSHRPPINEQPGPLSQGRLGRKSVLLKVWARVHLLRSCCSIG